MKQIYLFLFSILSFSAFSQMSTYNYSFDGETREFNYHIPSTYNPSTDTLPVVFFLHGMGGNMSNFSGFEYKSEQEKFIMIVPQALVDPLLSQTGWHSGAGGLVGGLTYYVNQGIDDVGFISSLIDTISSWYNVDSNRIFSTGFSMGGYMTNRLGCELGDRIAAIASVSGTIGNEIATSCDPHNIIPALHIHSTSDSVVQYYANNFGMNSEPLRDFWINNNNCDSIPDTTDLSNVASDGFSAIKYLYTGGDLGSEVEYYKLTGPDHSASWYTISSGNDFDAIEVIWDFFDRHEKKYEAEELGPNTVSSIRDVRMDVYPNPASNKITLNFSNSIEISKISIGDILGKIISSKTFEHAISTVSFNINNYANGVYFFKIEDIDGNKTVLRFYKN